MLACRADLVEIQSELLDEVDFARDLEGGGLAGVQHSYHLLWLPLLIPQHQLHSPGYLSEYRLYEKRKDYAARRDSREAHG